MAKVQLNFHCLTDKVPHNQSLLVFLQPVEVSDDYVAYAWEHIPSPGKGTNNSVEITNSFAGAVAQKDSKFHLYTDDESIKLGTALSVTNPSGGSPRFSGLADDVKITHEEVGIKNDCDNIELSCMWYVNDKKMCVTNQGDNALIPGQTSTFNLKQKVYLKFGVYKETETYSLQTFSSTFEFDIPKDGEVNFVITTDDHGALCVEKAESLETA